MHKPHSVGGVGRRVAHTGQLSRSLIGSIAPSDLCVLSVEDLELLISLGAFSAICTLRFLFDKNTTLTINK